MSTSLQRICLFLAISLLLGCTQATVSEENEPTEVVVLTVSGSGGTTPIVTKLADEIETAVSHVHLETLPGSGTSGGIAGLHTKALDIAAMGRPPTAEEADKITFLSFGKGAEIPVAHVAVGIENLTAQQLTAIFSGQITNWEAIGGPDLPIIVYVRAEATPHTEILRQTLFGDTPFIENAQVMNSMGEMLIAVAGTPGGIGYVNWPTAIALDAEVQPIAIDGLGPTDANYPAKLEIGIAYLPEREAELQPVLNWFMSDAGQTNLRAIGLSTQ